MTFDTADAGFVVELDRFTGPLELLLHLIREQDIDIFDIPVARITEQFLKAMAGLDALGLDRAGEFLEMAATLVRIKAQLLLPRRSDAEGELIDPRAELVRRLLEYEHFREAARRLEEAESARMRHFARGYLPPRRRLSEDLATTAEPTLFDAPARRVVHLLETTWDEVMHAAMALADAPRRPAEHRVVPRAVSLEEKITLVLTALAQLARVEFRRLVAPFADRLHAAVTLLAGLELAKRQQVILRQSEPFAPLWLYQPDGQGSDGDETNH